MPLLMCPNDNSAMQTVERSGVQFDMCPACRGVWLDRGELEKLMAPAAPAPAWSAAPGRVTHRDEGSRDDRRPDDRRYDDRGRPRKKKRDSIFEIFDFD